MPAVLEPKPAPAANKYDPAVEAAIADTGRKIRANDAMTGGLVVAAIALAYGVAVALLDRWLDLPQWARQLGLLAFLGTAGTAAWFLIVRPLRGTVNPRYVARKVEGTIPDAKNAIINWVDLQEKEIPGSVRAAMSQKAAAGLAESDPSDAVSSSRVAWAGGVVAFLVGVMAVLFLLYKSQFLSLLGRAFNPFSGKAIVTRTFIEMVEPADGNKTVTDGTQIGFAVRLSGSVPPMGSPQQARLKVRYAQDATEFDEYPFERGEKISDYSFTATRQVIQNGFWYRVAAGDAETPEYRITVRSRPMVTAFETKYEYPEYLRLKPDTGREPRIDGFRGTKVALIVKTNRTVKGGFMTVTDAAGAENPIPGEVVGAEQDSLTFKLELQERGTYSVKFDSTENESSVATPQYPIDVYVDQAPTVAILKPEQEEILLPTNGLLEVDALIGDDHGIASVALKFQLVGGPAIAPKPFREGKSFLREEDKSYPTSLDYKDSVKLDGLKDAAGKPVTLADNAVLEYWVEATDNCTVPKANVGKSKVQRVRLTKPVVEPMKQQEQKQQQEKRQGDEKQNNDRQDQKNKTEKRDPQPPQNREKDPNQPPPNEQNPNEMGQNDPKQPPEGDPKQNPMGQGSEPPKPNPEDMKTKEKAEDIQNKIDDENNKPGDAKGNSDPQKDMPQEPPAKGKPGDKNDPNQRKQEQQAGEGKQEPNENPMDPNGAGGEGKGAGDMKPPEKGDPKQEPKEGTDPNADPGQPEQQPKQGPKNGEEAGEGKGGAPQRGPMDQPKPGEKPRDTDPAGGKGAAPQPDPMDPNQKPDPKAEEKAAKGAGKAKPNAHTKPGEAKQKEPGENGEPGENPEPQPGQQPKNDPNAKPGTARDKDRVKEGAAKPDPKKGPPPAPEEKAGAKEEGKPEEKSGEGKAEGAENDPMAKPTEKSEPKPTQQGNGVKQGKPDPKQIQEDVKDLGSDDKAKQDAARERLDKTVGPENRKKAEDIAKGMKSGDPKKQADAQQKLDDLAKQAGGKPEEKKKLTPEEKQKLTDAAKDLNSPDDAKRQAAEKKVDEQIGKDQREKLQQQIKDFNQNVKDLGSDDKAKQDAAREKLDKTVGPETRKKAEQMIADQKSDDAKKREEAKKQQDELDKQAAAQKAKDPNAKPKELTPAEKDELAKAAKDLTDKDDAKRKEAEKKIDGQIGKDAREQLQRDLKDLQDPTKAEDAKKRLEEMAKEAKQREEWKPTGAGGKGPDGKPLETDPANRLKAAELQLDDFKKHKDNPEFLKKAGFTKEEYEKFLKGYEEMVKRERVAVEQAKAAEQRQPGDPKRNVSDGSGANTRLTGPQAQPGGPGAGGASVAPPGFSEAHKRFVEEALKKGGK